MTESANLILVFRVHQYKKEIIYSRLKEILELDGSDSAVEELYNDSHHGKAGVHFSSEPPLERYEERGQWQDPKFRAATDWLKRRSPRQIEQVHEEGWDVDICVGNYNGEIPCDLLREMARLNLSLWALYVCPICHQ